MILHKNMPERFLQYKDQKFFVRPSKNHRSAVIYYYNGADCVSYSLADLRIFAHQCQGLTDSEIADILEISVHTVSNTLTQCRNRNGKRTLELVALADTLGLLDPDLLDKLQNELE